MIRRGVADEVRRAVRDADLAHGGEGTRSRASSRRCRSTRPATAIVARTRRYAAYQRKWMRRIPGIVLVDADRPVDEVADDILDAGARSVTPTSSSSRADARLDAASASALARRLGRRPRGPRGRRTIASRSRSGTRTARGRSSRATGRASPPPGSPHGRARSASTSSSASGRSRTRMLGDGSIEQEMGEVVVGRCGDDRRDVGDARLGRKPARGRRRRSRHDRRDRPAASRRTRASRIARTSRSPASTAQAR